MAESNWVNAIVKIKSNGDLIKNIDSLSKKLKNQRVASKEK